MADDRQPPAAPRPAADPPLVEARQLVVEYPVAARGWRGRGLLRAVDRVDLRLEAGRVLALVGESGSGKTTVARAAIDLVRPTSGTLRVAGADLATLDRAGRHALRRRVQMVFQDPYASLDPRMTVGDVIAEPLRALRIGTKPERAARVRELLDQVGLPQSAVARYPHAFSGGQRQRIAIARALAARPQLVIADEPVSALDVSMQAQIVNLLADIREREGLALLFIAHDLAVVRQLADEIAVFHLGQVVEVGAAARVLDTPSHPYTQALMSAVPVPDVAAERSRERIVLRGDLPSPIDPPAGCRFHTRCPLAVARCRSEEPALRPMRSGALAACHLAG